VSSVSCVVPEGFSADFEGSGKGSGLQEKVKRNKARTARVPLDFAKGFSMVFMLCLFNGLQGKTKPE